MRRLLIAFGFCFGLVLGCAEEPVDGEPGQTSSESVVICESDDDCDKDEYCKAEVSGMCPDDPSFKGTCFSLPYACLTIYEPVCGCDGETYSNACYAAGAGVNVDYTGDCTKD